MLRYWNKNRLMAWISHWKGIEYNQKLDSKENICSLILGTKFIYFNYIFKFSYDLSGDNGSYVKETIDIKAVTSI